MEIYAVGIAMITAVIVGWIWISTDDLHSFIAMNGDLQHISDDEYYHRRRNGCYYIYVEVRYIAARTERQPKVVYFRAPEAFAICNESLKRRLLTRSARHGGLRFSRVLEYELV